MISNLDGNTHDATVALRGDVGLLDSYKWTDCRVGTGTPKQPATLTTNLHGGLERWRRNGSDREARSGGRGYGAVSEDQTRRHRKRSRYAWSGKMENSCRHQPIQFHRVCHIQSAGPAQQHSRRVDSR